VNIAKSPLYQEVKTIYFVAGHVSLEITAEEERNLIIHCGNVPVAIKP
jgi:hypothetical protein